jgi:transcriptional regulator with XRE-family HTH domain
MKSNIDENFLINNRIELGEKIRQYREAKGLTSQQLADQMNISRSTISKIEAGKWNYGIDTLNSFAVYLDFKVNI